MEFGKGQDFTLFFHSGIGKYSLVEELSSTNFEPAGVNGVVDNAHLVGFAVAYFYLGFVVKHDWFYLKGLSGSRAIILYVRSSTSEGHHLRSQTENLPSMKVRMRVRLRCFMAR